MFSTHTLSHPETLNISFIGRDNMMMVKKADTTVIVPKRALDHIDDLPMSNIFPIADINDDLDTTDFCAKEVTLDAQQSSKTFIDHHQTKYWIILAGIASVTLDGESNLLNKQQAILIPALVEHTIENVGDTALVFVDFQTKETLSGQEVFQFSRGDGLLFR